VIDFPLLGDEVGVQQELVQLLVEEAEMRRKFFRIFAPKTLLKNN
jgi:hypothetical protein